MKKKRMKVRGRISRIDKSLWSMCSKKSEIELMHSIIAKCGYFIYPVNQAINQQVKKDLHDNKKV